MASLHVSPPCCLVNKHPSDFLKKFIIYLFVAALGLCWALQVVLVVKNPSAHATTCISEAGSISGLGRSPGGGHGSPLQYSRLENPMERGVWQATVNGVAQSQM